LSKKREKSDFSFLITKPLKKISCCHVQFHFRFILFLRARLKQGVATTGDIAAQDDGGILPGGHSVSTFILTNKCGPLATDSTPLQINPKWLSRAEDFLQPREVHAFRLKMCASRAIWLEMGL
jgi:hypothetical protein